VTALHPAAHHPAVKPVDSWWTVAVVDPIAVRMLAPLARLAWVTPDGLTAAAFAVGIVSVAAFATGHLAIGAVLYEVRFLLDCLDGKLARVRGTTSAAGAAFDRLADSLTVPAAYAAIGWTLAQRHDWSSSLVLSVALMATTVSVCELSLELVRRGAPASTSASTSIAPGGGTASIALVRWMRRHRLTLRPWTVEAETVGLFLGPLVLSGASLGDLELAVAGGYAVFVAIDIWFIAAATRRLDTR
jgi:phosphatidylglycerophosphate synthase